jgi:tRNA G18 (ribose-2'-O)-methylase SpoU
MRKLSIEELNRVNVEEFKQLEKIPVVVVLDNVRSTHNVGAVFRTSDAFRISEIHLCGITPKPPHRDIEKTALGATESVSWKLFKETSDSILALRDSGYQIWCIEQVDKSVSLENWTWNGEKIALVFGHEVFGVDDEVVSLSDGAIEIPQSGTKHSLNISVSAGIVLWSFYRESIS